MDEIDNDFNSENSSAIPTLKKPTAVRKFPSYGWSREREARIRHGLLYIWTELLSFFFG